MMTDSQKTINKANELKQIKSIIDEKYCTDLRSL